MDGELIREIIMSGQLTLAIVLLSITLITLPTLLKITHK